MNYKNPVDEQVVRLVLEIDDLEEKLASAKRNAAFFKTPGFKEEYAREAKTLEEQIERKLQLIKLLRA